MKKNFYALVLCLINLSLCSCAEVPDEVKEDMSTYNQVENNDDKKYTLDYIDISELTQDVQTALQRDYDQFDIAENMIIEAPKEIDILKFKYSDSFEKKAAEILDLFDSTLYIDYNDIEFIDRNNGRKSYSYFDENEKIYRCVANNGFIAMLNPDAFDISFSYSEPNVRIYHVDRGDNLSDVYDLKDGEISVSQAVDYINSWLETDYKYIKPEYDYKVKTVIVRKHESAYLFEFTCEILINDIPLDSLTMEYSDDENNDTYMSYTSNKIEIQMININQIDSFTNGTGILEITESQKVDKIVSLESALTLCEDKFTDFKDVTISDIGIKYTTSPIYDYIGEKVTDEEGNISYTNMQSPYAAGITVNSHPVWEFIIDVKPEEFLSKGQENIYGDVRKYIYVDMITGELKHQLDVVLQGVG